MVRWYHDGRVTNERPPVSRYEIRTILGFNLTRTTCTWALFQSVKGAPVLLYTASEPQRCSDFLRTMQHQRRLPR